MIAFSGSGTDAEDGTLPPTALDWVVVLVRCATPGNCQETQLADRHRRGRRLVHRSRQRLPGAHRDPADGHRLGRRDRDEDAPPRPAHREPHARTRPRRARPSRSTASTARRRSRSRRSSAPPARSRRRRRRCSTTPPSGSRRGRTGRPRRTPITMPSSNASRTARFAPLRAGQLDAHVRRPRPTPWSSRSRRRPTTGPSTSCAPTAVRSDAESYLRFIVGGIAGKVTSAKLRLRSTDNDTADGPALRGTSNGVDGDRHHVAEQAAPPRPASIADVGAIDQGQWVEWDVTSLVAADGTYSFQLASRPRRSRRLRLLARRPTPRCDPELVVAGRRTTPTRGPRGATPAARPAGAGLRAVHRAEPRPRTTARAPVLQPAGARVLRPHVGTPDANGCAANSTGFALLKVHGRQPRHARGRGGRGDHVPAVRCPQRLGPARRLRGRAAVQADAAPHRPGERGGRHRDRPGPRAAGDRAVHAARSTRWPAATATSPRRSMPSRPGWSTRARAQSGSSTAIEVLDGGPDGDVDTPGNSVFARSGRLRAVRPRAAPAAADRLVGTVQGAMRTDCRLATAARVLALLAWRRRTRATLPPGFQESTAFSGLTEPIAVEFAPNGRVFVAEKSGIIKTYTNLSDTSATQCRRPAHPGPQLLGPRADEHRRGPELPGRPVRVRVLRARRRDRRHRAALGRGRPDLGHAAPTRRAATDGRVRGERAHLAPRR